MNEEERNNEEIIEKTNDSKKIIGIAVLIMTLVISVTSATYAYFAFSATNANTITGTTASISGTVTVTQVSGIPGSSNTGVMVPQYSAFNSKNALKQAVDNACVDGNKNIVCQVWKIAFQNTSVSGMTTSATLTLTSTMANLKWYTLKTGNNVTPVPTVNATPGSSDYSYPSTLSAAYGNAKTVTTLGTQSTTIDPQKYRYWYVVTWLEETGNNQYTADGNKTFEGTVTVNATDPTGAVTGITSTFRGA